ncbi:hypothetical protein B0T24DRAFT_496588, partial [Lasiosphaeria ovina]
VDWYWSLAEQLLRHQPGEVGPLGSSNGLRLGLENRIVGLYVELLAYQMMSICSYYRNRAVDLLRTALHLDDWDGSLVTIKDLEVTFKQDS